MAVVTAPKSEESRVLLENVRWSTYEALLEDIGPHPGKRITYDRGLLEIMTTSPRHGRIHALIGRLIEIMALELGIDVIGVGSATWKRKDLERGFEPDECYYIANEPAVREDEDIELPRDPPPDLIVEVDITSSSLKREAVHAAFGIPEAWRYDDATGRVRFYRLEGRAYREIERSRAFPFLAPADLDRFLAMRHSMSQTRLVRRFCDWVRETAPRE